MNNAEKTTALFGGKLVAVVFEDGTTNNISVRQLKLADYESAFAIADDEIAITAFCCRLPDPAAKPFTRPWALTLTPESYELLQATAQEVNAKGFFAYAERRKQKLSVENRDMLAAMGNLPPETLKLAMELGRSASLTSSPRPRPIPG